MPHSSSILTRHCCGITDFTQIVRHRPRAMPNLYKPPQTRAERRSIAREAAKELVRSAGRNNRSDGQGSNALDAGWFLAAFMALVLYLLAPKIGQPITLVVLVAMAGCLVRPIWRLRIVQAALTTTQRGCRFGALMLAPCLLISIFGVYVWPPIKRHPLVQGERARFENALKTEKGDDLEIQIACSPNDEKTCTYAGQFIFLIGDSGWKVRSIVDRLPLSRPMDGITIYRRGGDKAYMMQHSDAGGWFNDNEPHMLAMQSAFQSIHIEPNGGTDPDLPENVMLIYFGPERENEAEHTDLTRSTEWATGKRVGPFPGKRNTRLCRWFGLLCD